jgi:hypothetical protein
MFEHGRMPDNGHEKHSHISKDGFVAPLTKRRCCMCSVLIEDEDQPDDGTSYTGVICEN